MAKSGRKTTLIIVAVLGAILVAATAIIGLVSGFFNKDDLRKMGIRL